MRTRKLFTKERGKYGDGRKDNIKHVLIPEDLKVELDLFKDAYSICLSRKKDEHGNPIPVKVSYEQMFRRWMEQARRYDADVVEFVEKTRAQFPADAAAVAERLVNDLVAKAAVNGSTLEEEGMKEKEKVKKSLKK